MPNNARVVASDPKLARAALKILYDQIDWSLLNQGQALLLLEIARKGQENYVPPQKGKKKGEGVIGKGKPVNCPACANPLSVVYPTSQVHSENVQVDVMSQMAVSGYCKKCEELITAFGKIKEVRVADTPD